MSFTHNMLLLFLQIWAFFKLNLTHSLWYLQRIFLGCLKEDWASIFFGISLLWKKHTFQMTVHWLLLFQVRRFTHIISPSIAFHLLQCHGSPASLRFCFRQPRFSISCPCCTQEPQGKIPVYCFMSQHPVSSSHSLSLLIASLYFPKSGTTGSILASISHWITGAMQRRICHDVVLKRASLCDGILPSLL